ncbi:MAG: glycosyltransferase [Sedimentisphaerales bacterium]|nr:glycosyltransferase [Sedimentisphaerales bacterium]
MYIAIDAVGIRGHGGAAVLSELMHWFPKVRFDWKWHVFLAEPNRREFDLKPTTENVTIQTIYNTNGIKRLNWINEGLFNQLYRLSPDMLFSFANIAPAKPVFPQVAYVQQRNALFYNKPSFGTIKRSFRMRALRKHILRGACSSQAVIVQTQSMRRQLVELEPSLTNKIHVIPSGYRTPAPDFMVNSHKKQMIESLKRPRLIYVSHPSEHKNHTTLIKAIPEIAERFPDMQLLLTLEHDNPPDRRYRRFVEEIEKIAKKHDVVRHIVWLGRLNPEEVTYALSQSDLMVFPSLSESFGLAFVEAMAAGCPIAASDLPYAHDVAGTTAAYFNPQSPTLIAETIIRILDSKTVLNNMRDAVDKNLTQYHYQSIADRISSVFENVVCSDDLFLYQT